MSVWGQPPPAVRGAPEGLLIVARHFHWLEKHGSRNRVPDGTYETSARKK
jgi:hypothetical protein